MTEPALVSAVIATYNTSRYLPEAIDSIFAQDYPAWELIVVDDGSTDDTPNVLARYENDARVTVIRQANAGQTVAKNRGLAAAQGEYVGFCDADDAWLPDKLSRQVPCFDPAGRIGVVYGNVMVVDDRGRPVAWRRPQRFSGRVTAQLLLDNFVPFPTALVRRRIIEEVGGFDETFSMGIDYDLWLRISVHYDFHHLPRPLARYRYWEGQMSHKTGERLENFFRIFHKFVNDHPGAVTPAEVRRAKAHAFTTRGGYHALESRSLDAWRDYLTALRYRPHDWRLWKSMAKLVLGIKRVGGPSAP